MPWAKRDVPTELASTTQDLRESRDLLEDRFDTPGKMEKVAHIDAEVCIKPKAIPVPSPDTRPQSHGATERLENKDHNSGTHQLQLTMAFLTSGPVSASD